MATVAPPAKAEISAPYPSPNNGEARIGFGKLWDYMTNLLGTVGSPVTARTALGLDAIVGTAGSTSNRNRITNGAFGVNQRAKSGTVNLAAGEYGHDRWKGGAAGCTYTFSTSGITTTLTISAGSLVQVVESLNVEQADYTMSWTGTAQGRILAGSYAVSPVALTATPGSDLSVEFGTGTLTKVQVEPGGVATPFEFRPHGAELGLCQRYYCAAVGVNVYNGTNYHSVSFPATMRATPTMTFSHGSLTAASVIGFVSQYSSTQTFDWTATSEL